MGVVCAGVVCVLFVYFCDVGWVLPFALLRYWFSRIVVSLSHEVASTIRPVCVVVVREVCVEW
jgi:hypothetical protein